MDMWHRTHIESSSATDSRPIAHHETPPAPVTGCGLPHGPRGVPRDRLIASAATELLTALGVHAGNAHLNQIENVAVIYSADWPIWIWVYLDRSGKPFYAWSNPAAPRARPARADDPRIPAALATKPQQQAPHPPQLTMTGSPQPAFPHRALEAGR